MLPGPANASNDVGRPRALRPATAPRSGRRLARMSPTTPRVSTSDLAIFAFLGAVWGGSFLFMRIAAPEVGPLWAAEARIGLAAIVLLALFGRRAWPTFRAHPVAFVVVGDHLLGRPVQPHRVRVTHAADRHRRAPQRSHADRDGHRVGALDRPAHHRQDRARHAGRHRRGRRARRLVAAARRPGDALRGRGCAGRHAELRDRRNDHPPPSPRRLGRRGRDRDSSSSARSRCSRSPRSADRRASPRSTARWPSLPSPSSPPLSPGRSTSASCRTRPPWPPAASRSSSRRSECSGERWPWASRSASAWWRASAS